MMAALSGRLKDFGTSIQDRSRPLRRKAGAAARSIGVAIGSVFGFDELVLITGLTLVTMALWPDFGVRALLAPGLCAVWISLPTRAGFVQRPPQEAKKG